MKRKLHFQNSFAKSNIKLFLVLLLVISAGSIFGQGTVSKTVLENTVNGVRITVSADEGILPSDTKLTSRLLTSIEKDVYINELKNEKHVTFVQSLAYDITLLDGFGNEVQPNGEVTVSLGGLPFTNDENGLVVFHAETEGSHQDFTLTKKFIEKPTSKVLGKSKSKVSRAVLGKTLKIASEDQNQIDFKTNHFSVYLVGTTKTATYNFYVDGSLSETQIVLNGESLIEPENPTVQTGKRFTGWFVQSSSTAIDFNQSVSVNTTETKIVNAVFEDVWYVYFVYNSEIVSTKEVMPNGVTDENNIPISVTESGKAFAHWSLTENGSAFDFSTSITNNTSLYAVLTDQWTISFDSEGGSTLLPDYGWINGGYL